MITRINFDNELSLLHDDLKSMGEMIENAIDNIMMAFKNQDKTLAKKIVEGDRRINDMEKTIESRCLSLILKQQPVAKDLRAVSTALKVVTDMERIGDHAADIAEMILRIDGETIFGVAKNIPEMAKFSKQMVHDALDSFIANDETTAKAVITQDDIVDMLFNEVKSEVISLLQSGVSYVDHCIDILMIAKYMERIGDHAVNICEWTEFRETGMLQNVKVI